MGSILIYHVDNEEAGIYPAGYEFGQKRDFLVEPEVHEIFNHRTSWE